MPTRWFALLAVCAITGLATACDVGEEVVARSRNEAVAEQYGTDGAEAADESLTNPGQPLDCVGAIGAPPRKAAKKLRRLGFSMAWQEQWFDANGSGRSRRTNMRCLRGGGISGIWLKPGEPARRTGRPTVQRFDGIR